jgi:hypothetical protein
VCRYLDGDNFYALEVSSDGYYSILKRLAGEWTFLGADDWQFSDVIPQGEATLHIRADCAGDTLALYLDDVKLLEAQDADLTSGDVGLLAGTYETTGVDLLFDDFSVKQP